LAGWGIFWELLNCNDLGIFVDAETVFCRERVVVLVLGWESIVLTSFLIEFLCHICEIVLVIIVFYYSSLGCFAIMNRCLDHGPDDVHLGDDTLHLNKVVDQVRLESSGGDVVLSKVSLEVDVVVLDFGGESVILCRLCFF